jgi:hypothetical protein
MKCYHYNEPVFSEYGNVIDYAVKTVTSDEIIKDFYDFWEIKMIEKYGRSDYRITPENCIEDWVVVNWAWESDWGKE